MSLVAVTAFAIGGTANATVAAPAGPAMPVIHAPRAAVIEPNLAPGRYALLSWLIDGEARHQAARGMVTIVTVG